jgi:hypothetical protein
MEAMPRQSDLDWVSVRLPNIVEGPRRPIRLSVSGRGIGLSITAESAASFLVAQVLYNEHLKSTPSFSN